MSGTFAKTLIRLLTAVVLKMQITGSAYCEQPCKHLTGMLSATSVYTTGSELNYCLNTTPRLQQVMRHSMQLAEYNWPIIRHDAIAEQSSGRRTHTHTLSLTHTHTQPAHTRFEKGNRDRNG